MTIHEALAAGRRMGMPDDLLRHLAKALAPRTAAEKLEDDAAAARFRTANLLKAERKAAWDKMSFAEFAERRAAGTLPEKDWE